MPARRVNPYLVKLHRSYTVVELARRLEVHKNTVHQWQREGLRAIDGGRPVLFQGGEIRAFLAARNAGRKRPCPPGTFYCFRCREPRSPALAMVAYVPLTRTAGNLRARCATCGTLMHRRARREALAAVLPGVEVRMGLACLPLEGTPAPSLNRDLESRDAP